MSHSSFSIMKRISPFLQQCLSAEKPDFDRTELYGELINNSNNFPIAFPIETIRCHSLKENVGQDILEANIISTYPLIHERVLKLMCHFLIHKREYGSNVEKELYKVMSIIELVDRLLKKRAVSFVGPTDQFLLMNKEKGQLGWEKIGTDNETKPRILSDCLSYDELRLSAMLYVSGETVFINNGARDNKGVVEPLSESFEATGIIIGLIGTRLRVTTMEYQEIILTAEQNSRSNGYGKNETLLDKMSNKIMRLIQKVTVKSNWRALWAEFYDEPSLTYQEAFENYKDSKDKDSTDKYNKRYVFDGNLRLFDNVIYSKHLSVPFDCALLEANNRAKTKGTQAYLHVVGIGLGVWKAFGHQNQTFIKSFLERIRYLAPHLLNISDVDFAYFGDIPNDILPANGTFTEIEQHSSGGVKIHLSKRQPSSKLVGEHAGKLLVETYAWDGNAQPGNEFWYGSLNSSGDPAAACSSQVAELHNSHINKRFVCGSNLHVAGQHGLKHISEYVQNMLNNP